uniref:Copine-3 n=1 Tax=Steinernema glaseri TaxID=37863 RepID=A0A1I7ZVG1_9BILA
MQNPQYGFGPAVVDTNMPTPGSDLCSKLRLTLSARGLRDLDYFSKSDPLCVVYMLRDAHISKARKVEIGRTEIVKNCLDPEWNKTFVIDYYFEEKQPIIFEVFDADSKSQCLADHDFIGSAETTVGDIVGAQASTKFMKLVNNRHTGPYTKWGELKIVAEEADDAVKEVAMVTCHGVKLDKKDFFGKSDPFLKFYRIAEGNSKILVHQTEVIKRNLNPKWKPFEASMQRLCMNNPNTRLRIECFDYDRDGGHDYIGSCETTFERLRTKEDVEIPLINEKKREKKGKKYKDSGRLVFDSVSTRRHYTFIEYITAQTRLDFSIAIDLTASNGNPLAQNSLHYIDPTRCNQYQLACRAIAEILAPYNPSRTFEAMGFGAKIPPQGQTSFCFPLNMPSGFQVSGVDGIMNAYASCIRQVRLFGPTNFSPVINRAADIASCYPKDGSRYQVLLIITDGIISDFEPTIHAIIGASYLPLSIIIVGVGNDDFSRMEDLDSDSHLLTLEGRTAQRDIVQFVALRDFLSKYANANEISQLALLAKEVLAEVPAQVASYMNQNGIVPKPVDRSQIQPEASMYPPVNPQPTVPMSQPAYPANPAEFMPQPQLPTAPSAPPNF